MTRDGVLAWARQQGTPSKCAVCGRKLRVPGGLSRKVNGVTVRGRSCPAHPDRVQYTVEVAVSPEVAKLLLAEHERERRTAARRRKAAEVLHAAA